MSLQEFWAWSISSAADHFGPATLKKIFKKYDSNGNGKIDPIEFEKMSADMGFGAAARDMFHALDRNKDGAL